MSENIRDTRTNYQRGILMESSLAHDPVKELSQWLEIARTENVIDYNAFTLSTVDQNGFPGSRIVLLRDLSEHGLVFYTNYESAKGKAIAHHNKVSASFYWNSLERQVRILGVASQVSARESDEYFMSRPRESRIAAWASKQSHTLSSRSELDQEVERLTKEFEGREVERPPFWGGYRITPVFFEFWQGRANRLHDRLIYRQDADGEWFVQRLAP